MARLNRGSLLGHVGQSPVLRYTEKGTAILNFSVATDEGYKDKETQEWVKRTEWHRIVVFGDRAEAIQEKITKGTPLFVEGRLQTRSWEDKEGIKRYVTEIVAYNVQVLTKRTDGVPPPTDEDLTEDGDLPF